MNLLTQKVVVMSHFHLKIKRNEFKREKEKKKQQKNQKHLARKIAQINKILLFGKIVNIFEEYLN